MSDAIERSLEIEQAQLRGFARSIAEVEWLLLILVVLYLFIVQPGPGEERSVLGAFARFRGVRAGVPLRAAVPPPRAREARDRDSRDARVPDGGARVRGRDASPLVNLYLLPIVTAALALGKRAERHS